MHPITMHRAKNGLTQAELARRIGVAAFTVWRWEHGEARPSAINLFALAREFGIDFETLADELSDYEKGQSNE